MPTTSRTRARERPKRAGAEHVDGNEVAVLGGAEVFGGDHQLFGLLLGDRQQAGTGVGHPEDAEDAGRLLLQHLHDAWDAGAGKTLISIGQFDDAGQHPVTEAGGRTALAATAAHGNDDEARPRPALGVPFGRLGVEVAVAVAGDDVAGQHGRQRAGLGEAAVTALDQALALQLLQEPLQHGRGPRRALPEGAGDVALRSLAGICGDEAEDRLTGGDGGFVGGAGLASQASVPLGQGSGRHRP